MRRRRWFSMGSAKTRRLLSSIAIFGVVLGLSPTAIAVGAQPGWSLQHVPSPDNSSLYAVSCPSSSMCWAVGVAGGNPLVDQWNGVKWGLGTSPSLPANTTYASLTAVSCPTITFCMAVGFANVRNSPGSPALEAPLAEEWSDNQWQMVPTPPVPSPSPGASEWEAEMSGVACTAPNSCVGVGVVISEPNSGSSRPLIERWDGATWTVQSGASLPPQKYGYTALQSVSCGSAGLCVATGLYQSLTGHNHPFAERGQGAAWTVQRTASADGADLRSVSCPVRGTCAAVGEDVESASTYTPFIERWQWAEHRWEIQPASGPNSSYNVLAGVSCPNVDSCVAVGSGTVPSVNGSQSIPLSESWDGQSWAVQQQQPVNPRPGWASWLSAVACPSPNTCFAVGTYNVLHGEKAFAEAYSS